MNIKFIGVDWAKGPDRTATFTAKSRFIFAVLPFLEKLIKDCQITIITASELLAITEEDPDDFLARDPANGYFEPEEYAGEVIENFNNNEVYYYDKLLRAGKPT